MKNKFKFFTLIFMILTTSLKAYSFSQKDIISPAQGVWGNLQPLVLNCASDEEVFYSLTGLDPLVSGFSYDGPILIDEEGDVTLKITVLSADGTRSDFSVNYSVVKSSYNINSEEYNFIQSIKQNPILPFYSGTEFELPETFLYSTSNSIKPYLAAKKFTLNEKNIFERYVPFTISDKKYSFHFVLQILQNENAVNGKLPFVSRSVPFEIRDWENFKFTGKNFIYQIDNEYWGLDLSERKLDRSVWHTVRWQSIAYEKGNPVQQVRLPPKPEVQIVKNSDRSETAKILSDKKFLFVPENSLQNTKTYFYDSVTVDTFEGDDLTSNLNFSIYYENVFQGKISVPFSVDKRNPQSPLIQSSSVSSYTRKDVNIEISGEEDCRIFYAVSEAFETDSAAEIDENLIFNKISADDFKLYDGNTITLRSSTGKVSFYKISAYCEDLAGNKSVASEYCVVLDEFNYYLDPSSESKIADGTYLNPFVSFEQALETINKNEYTILNVKGNIFLSQKEYNITSDCLIKGNQGHFIFGSGTLLCAKNVNLGFENMILEKDATSYSGENSSNFFESENSSVSIKSCELIGIFEDNGILLNFSSGTLNLEDCGLTVNSLSYACALNTLLTKINCKNSRITSSAETAVNFSVNGAFSNIENSNFTVISKMGRCLEFVEATAKISGNTFSANLTSDSNGSSSVWKDADSNFLLNENNNQEGF